MQWKIGIIHKKPAKFVAKLYGNDYNSKKCMENSRVDNQKEGVYYYAIGNYRTSVRYHYTYFRPGRTVLSSTHEKNRDPVSDTYTERGTGQDKAQGRILRQNVSADHFVRGRHMPVWGSGYFEPVCFEAAACGFFEYCVLFDCVCLVPQEAARSERGTCIKKTR